MLITSSFLLDLIIALTCLVFVIHFYVSTKYKYWRKRNLHIPPTKPFVGNFLDVLLLKTTTAEWMKSYYDEIDKEFFGVFIFSDLYFVAKDPQLIKKILIKDFDHFVDRNIGAPKHCPFTAQMTFIQKSPEWRYGRSKLSSAFTSGKIKSMFPLFLSSADQLVDYLEKNQYEQDAKELVAKYSTDIIAKCAFGINSYSFEKNDSAFTAKRKRIFATTFTNALRQLIYFFKPNWVNIFEVDFVEKNTMDYFIGAFQTSVKSREKSSKQLYNDLIDIFNQLKSTNEIKSDGSDDSLFCGAAMQFFLAGFETTSATISFTLYEFATKPYIQKAVREEIIKVLKEFGEITYDALQEMVYLDMCVTETLRRYPPLPFLERKCNKDYPIPGGDFVIEKNTPILIPMYAIQMDDKYYPDPFTYNPERFKEKLDNSNGLLYLPFGHGPRNCLGERFGLVGTKMALVNIVLNFEITKSDNTPEPIVFDPKSIFLLQSTVGIPLKFAKLKYNL